MSDSLAVGKGQHPEVASVYHQDYYRVQFLLKRLETARGHLQSAIDRINAIAPNDPMVSHLTNCHHDCADGPPFRST
jgi:hypothetical protein